MHNGTRENYCKHGTFHGFFNELPYHLSNLGCIKDYDGICLGKIWIWDL